jgi:hypothetical protein
MIHSGKYLTLRGAESTVETNPTINNNAANVSIMGDDLVNDGILPSGGTSVDDEFDPNAVESDDFLDDPVEVLAEEAIDPAAADEDDEPIEVDE